MPSPARAWWPTPGGGKTDQRIASRWLVSSRDVECSKQFIRKREAIHAPFYTGDRAGRSIRCFVLRTPAAVKTPGFVETDLIANKTPLTDKNGHVHTVPQAQVDGNLLNPWGLTFSPLGSAFWVSDNGARLATLYIVPGNTQNSVSIAPLVVNIPAPLYLAPRQDS